MSYFDSNMESTNIIHNNRNIKLTVHLNKSSRKSITRFEDLSNELIYDVFEYLDFFRTYSAFFNLNTRFQNLLTSIYFPIDINLSHISKGTFEQYYSNILERYRHQIRSLYLSNPFIINRLFIPIEKALLFTRLEKLTLIDVVAKCLEKILIHLFSFPRLISLVIVCIDPVYHINTLYRQIFRLPTLKYFKLSCNNSVSSLPLSVATTEFSPITYLVIDHIISLNNLSILLSYFPQLRRLKLNHLVETTGRPIKLQAVTLKHLTHVSIQTDISFDLLECLIQNCFHRIKVLYISNEQDIKYLNAQRWQELILCSMPYLTSFDMNICHDLRVNEDIVQYPQQMDQFQSSFWFERQWFFEYQLCKNRTPNSIFFYSTNPYRRKHFTLYEENHTKTNLYSVNKVYIQNCTDITNCRNYFPNATELSISNGFVTNTSHSFSTLISQILPLRHLTTLIICGRTINFANIMEFLSYAPNIHTIFISFRIDISDLVQLQQSETFHSVFKTNKIQKITIVYCVSLAEIEFFVKLCPRLEHLTLFTSTAILKQAVPFLLSKGNIGTLCLSSLHIATFEFEANIEALTTFMESEKLVKEYMANVDMGVFGESIYLWQ